MKDFEYKIISELLEYTLGESFVFPESESKEDLHFSGVGYFLTLKNTEFSKERIVLDKPDVLGKLDGIDVGFIGLIQDNELTLECYTFNDELTKENRTNGFKRTKT